MSLLPLFIYLSIWTFPPNYLPKLDLSYENSKVYTMGEELIISTGKVERTYSLTSFGLKTKGFRNLMTNTDWINANGQSLCDWVIGSKYSGELVSLNAKISDDEQFTDKHIRVEAEFEYPENHLRLKYIVWVYPGAEGLRAQVQLKALPGFDSDIDAFRPDIMEKLDLKESPTSITAFGYMQGIKTNMEADILKEKMLTKKDQKIEWANGLVISNNKEGVILIKESNKSTSLRKKQDVATGNFLIKNNEVLITGAGMYPENLRTDKYLSCWANWVVLYSGGAADAHMALKKFDRRRFPVHPERDVFIMANTWGTEDMRPECLYAAREENVLKELESVADLGIDILQIDDGWQTKEWLPAKHSREHQHQDVVGGYDIYPDGWVNVKRRAEELNIKLGLWASWIIPEEKLKLNYDNGNFSAFKLDFANLNTIKRRDELMSKARELIKHSSYNTSVNWDVTETPPRVGFFYGREYGNVYLENRKVTTGREVVQYVPYKVLRDTWLLSKYVNINKFQVTVQNIDMAKDTTKTDAQRYNHPYVVGIALMSSPIFFQETHYYSQNARDQIRPLLAVYKKHRKAMYEGYTFPIGDVPDNSSWTGFQNHHMETKSGYLTIFRELHNNENSKGIALKFIENKKLRFTDLRTNESTIIKMDGEKIDFKIDHPAGFKFLKYEILN